VNLNDLPRWSPWPARLLGISPWEAPDRTVEKVDAEYDKDKYAGCLAFYNKAVAPECKIQITGIRPGEKLHEILISAPESRHTVELEDMYVIQPVHSWWELSNWPNGVPLKDGFEYTSDTNEGQLTITDLQKMI